MWNFSDDNVEKNRIYSNFSLELRVKNSCISLIFHCFMFHSVRQSDTLSDSVFAPFPFHLASARKCCLMRPNNVGWPTE